MTSILSRRFEREGRRDPTLSSFGGGARQEGREEGVVPSFELREERGILRGSLALLEKD